MDDLAPSSAAELRDAIGDVQHWDAIRYSQWERVKAAASRAVEEIQRLTNVQHHLRLCARDYATQKERAEQAEAARDEAANAYAALSQERNAAQAERDEAVGLLREAAPTFLGAFGKRIRAFLTKHPEKK